MVIALPVYLARELGFGPGALALLFLPGAAGVASGLAWCGRGLRAEALVPAMRLSLVTLSGAALAAASLDLGVTLAARRTPLGLFAVVDSGAAAALGVAMLVALAVGFALTVSLAAARGVLSATAPMDQQGRVFAIQEAVSEAVIVLPLLLAGAGAHALGARPVLAAVGITVLAACLVGEFAAARRRPAAAAARA
jgi:MFS-type transporter involved in bile tolerance (Atg22 family)